jgi:hypothetical protein
MCDAEDEAGKRGECRVIATRTRAGGKERHAPAGRKSRAPARIATITREPIGEYATDRSIREACRARVAQRVRVRDFRREPSGYG